MLAINKTLCVSARGRFHIIAVGMALTLTAGSLHAAGPEPIDVAASRTAAPFALLNCSNDAHGSKPFAGNRADGGMRTIEICSSNNQDEYSGFARALSAAMEAEAGKSAFYSHARMPELLSLRLSRARADVDTSTGADDRAQKLAKIELAIKALEDEISKTAQAN